MIQVFKTDEDYKKWLDGQTLPSGIVVYVSDDETMYFSTNNIKGELKTYKCEKEEPIQPIQHEYVDLGLPSGLKWAKCNVGAEKETDAGLYFAWGETTGYTASQVGTDKQFSWSDYKYGNSDSNLTKYNQSDGNTVLESTDDAVSQIMGGNWRMPTKDEFDELLSGTTNEWIANYEGTGVKGRKFTSKTDTSKYIFIPAAGYCDDGSVDDVGYGGYVWSSSLDTSYPSNALNLYFDSGDCYMSSFYRCAGLSVRGVRK